MFSILKEKLRKAISVFSKNVEEELTEEKAHEKTKERKKRPKEKKTKKKEVVEEKKGIFEKFKERFVQKEEIEEKKGIFEKVADVFTTKTLSEKKFEELFQELEITLLESNVALSVIEKIKEDLKGKLLNKKLNRFRIKEEINEALIKSVSDIISFDKPDFLKTIKELIKKEKPVVLCFFGNNGNGKTTTIAKIAALFKKKNISCVLAAADTFRAAAIDQLQKHGDALGIKVIKQGYGADAAAVAFDAIQHAKAHKIDVVLIDTAGRSHSNVNLMDELKKIVRVSKPHLKIFVGDALTGNDMVEQAEKYNEEIGIDAIVLAKADVDEKGGATISVSYVVKKPIYFLGTGQSYNDLEEFDREKIIANIFG